MTSASIAMCTYNGARFRQGQLESLSTQTVQPSELIICDDSSSDESVAIAQKFAAAAPFPVRVHKNSSNLGYVKNFEKAISLCTQDIVFLCDQDDIWNSRKLELVLEIFATEPEVGLVLHDFDRIDDVDQSWVGPIDTYGPNHLSANDLPEEIKRNSIDVFMRPYPRAWCGCMMAFRRRYNEIVLPIFPGKGHDDWILKILAPITEIRFIAQPLTHYRMHQNNTNRRDLRSRTLAYLLNRALKKIHLALSGQTKSNFYKEIIKRLTSHEVNIQNQELINKYKNYIKFL